ncbi:MAG: hypothetical protein IPM48_14555 [Saprospiraceae bacterium]|nr:hypothetical protein [Saprospiraceae bacterium]
MALAWTKDTAGTLNTGFVAGWNLEDVSDSKRTVWSHITSYFPMTGW